MMHFFPRLSLASLVVLSSHAGTSAALPTDSATYYYNGSHPFAEYPPVPALVGRQDRVALRIMPLGASIMSGVGSPEHSGLRKWLRAALRNDGWDVNMVGSYQHGTDMTDKDHEAVPGDLLDEIATRLHNTRGYKPNIVIINGGTNNANGGVDVDKAGAIMEGILNDIWNYEGMANTCVILSTLLPTTHRVGVLHRITINGQFRKLVTDYNRDRPDKCIYLADMEPTGVGQTFFDINGPYWADEPKIHPNNEGHKRMAYVFYAAIQRALRAGKVKEAAPKESEPSTGCDKVFHNGIDAGANTQNGWGVDDGIYYHDSAEVDVALEWKNPAYNYAFRVARLFSPDYHDVVEWFELGETEHRFHVWTNSANGQGKFTKSNDINPDLFCIPRGLHFIDMNGDGLDDIVCIDPHGDLYLSINQGGGNFKRASDTALIRSTGAAQDRVRLADIDGDGRGDYGVVANDGSIRFWRNGGNGNVPAYWQDLGVRSTMKPGDSGTDALAGIRFADINGDGRDDWLWMNKKGATTTWTNTRSCAQGQIGDGLHVSWRQGFHKGSSSGPTHTGFGSPGHGNPDLRMQVFFGRIFGTKPAFGNLGVMDYVYFEIEETTIPLAPSVYSVKMRVFRNTGAGGTKLLADGNKYCNMVGNDKGRMDYVWTWSTGKMRLFPNAGKNFIKQGESFWSKTPGDIWTPPTNMDRRDLHLTDWDGDGDCDIVWVNPENGNVRVFINDYPTKKTWDGAFREIQAPQLSCSEKRGLGIHDLAVRFADITGNGRSDYLCIAPNGKVKGYVQKDDGAIQAIPQIKFAETDKDRANFRWADVNGDGKDDMIWVDKFTGNGYVWYNEGPTDDTAGNGDSWFHWRKVSSAVYAGDVAGQCIYYPDLDGNGRADQHSIHGTWTNKATTSYNPSCGLEDVMGDDPEGVIDPHLPVQPGNPIDGPGPGEPGNTDEPQPGDNADAVCRDLDKGGWRDVHCDSKYIKSNTGWTDKEQWDGIYCPDAWLAALGWWQCLKTNNLEVNLAQGFPNAISDFFHQPPGFRCDLLSEIDGCSASNKQQCDEQDPGPAGYYIYNSLAVLHTIYKQYYMSLDTAVVFTNYEGIAEHFSKLDEPNFPAILNILIDAATLGFALVAGPAWNLIALRGLESAGANAVKDTVNDVIYNGATIAKDILAAKIMAEDPASLKLGTAVREMASAWKQAIYDSNTLIWNGSPDSIRYITDLIADGHMLSRETAVSGNLPELQKRVTDTLTAFTIPFAWAASSDHIFPVIVREDFDCETKPNPSWTGTSASDLVTADAYKARYCNADTGFKSHWLLAPHDYIENCALLPTLPGTDLICGKFPLPPGYEQLTNGTSGTYGVSLADVVQGSLNTWEAGGRRNGHGPPELTAEFMQTLEDKGIRAPGVFSIPVCSMEEVQRNWKAAGWDELGFDKVWAGFPCDKP